MAAIRVQIWLNPHSIVAPDEGRARRAASQLPRFNKDREVCWCLRKNDGEKSRGSFRPIRMWTASVPWRTKVTSASIFALRGCHFPGAFHGIKFSVGVFLFETVPGGSHGVSCDLED